MVKRFLQNCRKPQGLVGRMVANSMNGGHAVISSWGISHLHVAEDAHVLDVGCGGGANLARLLEMCPRGKAYGIDYSEQSVAVSRKKNAAALGSRCEILQGSVSELPYKNESFDAVTAFETVYFWPNIAGDFAQVFRVLKPGGTFLICNEVHDPTDTTWTGRIDGMTVYSEGDLREFLTDCGFTVESTDVSERTWLCVVARKL